MISESNPKTKPEMKVALYDGGDLTPIAKVLLELRNTFTLETLLVQLERQLASGYQLAYVSDGDNVICVAGFVIEEKLAWGKHVYVDDLVTLASWRSQGAGERMLAWLIEYCKSQSCAQLHLDSGVQRFEAHRFYLSHGFKISSHHLSISFQ